MSRRFPLSQLLLREPCPLTIIRVEFIHWITCLSGGCGLYVERFSHWGVGAALHALYAIREGGRLLRAMISLSADWKPCHQKPLSLNFHSNCQCKTREMTPENSWVLKNHSIHPSLKNHLLPYWSSTYRFNCLGIFGRLGKEGREREGRGEGFEELQGKWNKISSRKLHIPWQATQQPLCGRFWWLYSWATQQTRAVGMGTQQLRSAPTCYDQEDLSRRCLWGHVFMSCLGNW